MSNMGFLGLSLLFVLAFVSSAATKAEDLKLTIVYDNNPYKEGLETGWGFSCLIEGAERTILFDTGGDGSLLLANMEKLGIAPEKVEIVVLSHIHGDHVGGLSRFLERSSRPLTVYLPKSFPERFKAGVKQRGAKVAEVDKAVEICERVYTTGELRQGIKEQSLLIRTAEGLVVITGCAHPGVVHIVEKARELFGKNVYLVMGGFHLGGASSATLRQIVDAIQGFGVKHVAPCHCSGDSARKMFAEAYGEDFIRVGVGKSLEVKGAFVPVGKSLRKTMNNEQ
jgi:7,8-dihydropterin-6-yl-methyl-4-(beta-D-ribofuranosyl)aminobenzene 5'-phosphate synthase